MNSLIFHAPDITCSHCQKTIKKALEPLRGVHKVEVDIPTQQITVEYESSLIDPKTLARVLEEHGYPVDAKLAPKPNQAQRGSCCGSCTL